MKVSIITICLNNEHDIVRTITSVVNQTYTNIEYIIVNGGSTDKTIEKIQNFKDKISKIITEKDDGIYDAINKGIRNATGDVVGLIHAGDELYNNTVIEEICNCFKINEIEALYGNSKIYTKDGLKVVRINKSPQYKQMLFKLGWFPSHQSFYAKRELFEKYGYYNLKYQIAADYELLFRFVYIKRIKVMLYDNYILKFRLGGTSTKNFNSIKKLNKECIEAWHDHGLAIPFYTIPLKLLRKIEQILLAKLS